MEKDKIKSISKKAVKGQVCGFRIKNELYAVSVEHVQEVVKPHTVTKVPLADHYIEGLINLRGQIVTLINLRKLFNADEKNDEDYMNVIVRTNDVSVAIMVDEICDIMELEEENFEKSPETLEGTLKDFVKGVHRLPEELLVILDIEKIVDYAA